MKNTFKIGQQVIIQQCHKHDHGEEMFPEENEGKRGVIANINEQSGIVYPNRVHIEGEEDCDYAPCELRPVLPDNIIDGVLLTSKKK